MILAFDTLSDMNSVFQSLLYGTGSYIGLLIILAIMLPLVMQWREACVLMLPVAVFLMFGYLQNGLGWQALIFGFSSFFILFVAATKKK